jgi:polysaccharide export outer membrane protein
MKVGHLHTSRANLSFALARQLQESVCKPLWSSQELYMRRPLPCHSVLAVMLCCVVLGGPPSLGQQHARPADVDPHLKTAPSSSHSASQNSEASYKIGAGDVLQVAVWREDNLSQRVMVRPDGKITLPLVAELAVAGKTPLEVRDILQKSYSAYIEHPAVMVTVVEMNSQVVYILGEVQRPGAYPMTRNMDVLQLIASAGGLTPFSKKKGIYLLHDDTKQRSTIDYAKLLKGKGSYAGTGLNAGDLVVVP